MVFFLMKTTYIMFLIINSVSIFLIFFRNGKFVKDKKGFILIQALVLFIIFSNYMALPSNYLLLKGLNIALMIVGLSVTFIYKELFNIARIILAVVTLISLLELFI